MPQKLTIIIPVYNEAATIIKILNKVENQPLVSDLAKEIIVIDDASTDGTREILKNYQDKYKIFYQNKNQGKGAAVRLGFQNSTGDIILIQDADLEYDPENYQRLLEPILRGSADVVYGSRILTNEAHRILFFWHYLANKFLTKLSNFFTNLSLTDIETGYKVFSRPAMEKMKDKIKSQRFGIEVELTALVAKNNFRIYEVGISYYGRTYQEGKKINWLDGLAALGQIIKYNLFS